MSSQIEQIYYRYGPMVLRRCQQLLPDNGLAQEAMQDVFAELIHKQNSLDLTTPSSLLYRMATNVCLNIVRERKIKFQNKEGDILIEIANDENLEQRTIANNILNRIFGKQTESTKTIAMLHYYDGMILQEVAKEVDLSVSGVRKRLRQFKRRIEKLKDEIHE